MYIIKDVSLVNEGQIVETDVLIKDERIEKIGRGISDKDATYINGKDKYLIPGIIDDQVHFREPGFTHKAAIDTESKAAIAGGVTTFIEQPNTNPQTTNIKNLEEKFEIAKNNSYANYSFMLGGTNDNLEEIKKLPVESCAGIKLFLGSSTGNMLVDNETTLENIFSNTNMVISVHCEDETTIQKNLNYYKSKYGNDIPIKYHPNIRSEKACWISSSKTVKLAQKTGARLHVFHISTKKELKLFNHKIPIEQKKITAEACVHHLWFSKKDYKTKGALIKWNPAIKKRTDAKALLKGIVKDKIDVIASDHAPHTLEEKNNPYVNCPSGGPLVQHTLLVMLDFFRNGKISFPKIVEKMCHNPAIIFQIKERGFIREGYYADLVLIDPYQKQQVYKSSLLYKCQWSPFEGHEFQSKITHTFLNGQLAFSEGKITPQKFSKRLTFNRNN